MWLGLDAVDVAWTVSEDVGPGLAESDGVLLCEVSVFTTEGTRLNPLIDADLTTGLLEVESLHSEAFVVDLGIRLVVDAGCCRLCVVVDDEGSLLLRLVLEAKDLSELKVLLKRPPRLFALPSFFSGTIGRAFSVDILSSLVPIAVLCIRLDSEDRPPDALCMDCTRFLSVAFCASLFAGAGRGRTAGLLCPRSASEELELVFRIGAGADEEEVPVQPDDFRLSASEEEDGLLGKASTFVRF